MCLLRINMVAVRIVFCCAVLLQGMIMKRLNEIPYFLLWFLVGAGLITFPIFYWLVKNNAFTDFINDYFVFNKIYTQDANWASSLNKYNSFSYFLNNIYILTAIIFTGFLSRDKKVFHIAYLLYEVAALLLICISGQRYAHYGMVLVPMLVYPFSVFLSEQIIKERLWILAFMMYLLVSQVAPTWIGGLNKVAEYCLMENKTEGRNDTVGKVCAFIVENTNEDDRIIVWENWNIIYVQSQRLPASKYSYQSPIGNIDKRIMKDFFEELTSSIPELIVIPKDRTLDEMEILLNEHHYVCVYEIDGVTVYM